MTNWCICNCTSWFIAKSCDSILTKTGRESESTKGSSIWFKGHSFRHGMAWHSMAWYGTTRHTVLLVTHYIKHMLFKIKLLVVSLFSLYHFVHCTFIINILDNVFRVNRFCRSATMRKQVVMFNSKYFNKFITFHRILQIVIWNEQRIRMERPMHTPSWSECTLHSAHTSSLPPIH